MKKQQLYLKLFNYICCPGFKTTTILKNLQTFPSLGENPAMFLKTLQFQNQQATLHTTEATTTKERVLFGSTQFAHAQQSHVVPCTVLYNSAVVRVQSSCLACITKAQCRRKTEQNEENWDKPIHILATTGPFTALSAQIDTPAFNSICTSGSLHYIRHLPACKVYAVKKYTRNIQL